MAGAVWQESWQCATEHACIQGDLMIVHNASIFVTCLSVVRKKCVQHVQYLRLWQACFMPCGCPIRLHKILTPLLVEGCDLGS